MSDVSELMKRCQRGVGGRNALDEAHDIMAECYGTLGRLESERDALRQQLAERDAQIERLQMQLAACGEHVYCFPDCKSAHEAVSKEQAVLLWYEGFRSEPIPVLEAWEAIGHDIGCNPSKQELLDSLRNMAAICEAHGNDMPKPAQHARDSAELAAIKGQGEVVEVVGMRIRTDGFGSYIADFAMGVPAAMPGEVREQLMTVAQHQRIVAALSAQQSAHVSVPRELLEDLRDCANECYNHARFRGTSGLDTYERLTEEADALLNGGEA